MQKVKVTSAVGCIIIQEAMGLYPGRSAERSQGACEVTACRQGQAFIKDILKQM